MNSRFFCGFITVILLFLGCGPSPEENLAKLAPKLDPEMVRMLVAPDSMWVRYCDNSGLLFLQETALILRDAKSLESEASYLASRDQLRPYLERVSRCLRDKYYFEGEWTEFEAWSQRTFEQAKEQVRLKLEFRQVFHDKTLTLDQRLIRIRQIEAGFRAANSVNGVVAALDAQHANYDELGDPGTALEYLHKALMVREKAGRHTTTMSFYIMIGHYMRALGKVDSMLVYYNRALDMAKESRDPMNTTRALSHLALYHQRRGEEALAYELFRESFELCREFKGDNYEFMSILDGLTHYTRYGIWNVAEDLLERGDRVVAHWNARARRNPMDGPARDRIILTLGLFKGRYLMANGSVEEGEELFRELRSLSDQLYRTDIASLLYFWSSSLLQCDMPQQATKLAREGVAFSDSTKLQLEARRLNLVLAEASCRLGESQEAQKALDRFRESVGLEESDHRRHWMVHDAVRICLALAAGDTTEAEGAAEVGLTRLVRLLKPLDQSVQASLFLDECRGLREATHRVLSNNPEAGYGFEIAWRSLYTVLGKGPSSNGPTSILAKPNGSLGERCASLGRRIQKQVSSAGAIHSVYFADPKDVTRWTAGAEGVVRERVPIASDGLRHGVEMITSAFAGTQSGSWSREVAEALNRLSILLPSSMRDANRKPGLFLVSPDLYLSNLPFEAINLDQTEDYRPLIETWDVAYLRTAQSHHAHRVQSKPGIVLVSPQYPATLKRRYPTLAPLPYGEKEAALVAASFPGTVTLRYDSATKLGLGARWEDSPFIYVASHFIQSAETPYISYLPLAAPENTTLSEAVLDYGEVRKADLSGCELVVLSGCGTGAAYANSQTTAPSLSDAFLDAGAQSAVHTRWRVGDDEAYEFAQDFIARWARGETPLVALNEARRNVWRTRGDSSTTWMSYAVTLSEIPTLTTLVKAQ